MDAYLITGPTSGIGRATAFRLAKKGVRMILISRSLSSLQTLKDEIVKKGYTKAKNQIELVVCDLADLKDCQRCAKECIRLTNQGKEIRAILNNAGVFSLDSSKTNKEGHNLNYTTNCLGPLMLTNTILSSVATNLKQNTQILFVVSAVEDDQRQIAIQAGFTGAKFNSVLDSVQNKWAPLSFSGLPPSKLQGADAYATSKQSEFCCAMSLSRLYPSIRINCIEPGWIANTGLGRDAGVMVRYTLAALTPLFALGIKHASTVKKASSVICKILCDENQIAKSTTGVYYDENGAEMKASVQASDIKFQDQVLTEALAFLKAYE